MRGKIISSGVIMGDDGKKYFYVGEFTTNSFVEFEAQDDRAVNINIVQSESSLSAELPFINNGFVFWDFRKIKESFSTMNIHSVKFFIFISLITSFLSSTYGMSISSGVFLWGFISFLCAFWAVFSLCHLASNYALMKAFCLTIIVSVILSLLSAGTAFGALLFGRGSAYVLGTLSVITLIILVLCIVLYVRILAKITHEPFFLYALGVLILAGIFFGIASLLKFRGEFSIVLMSLAGICVLISSIFYILAWLRFRDISIEQNATLKSEFLGLFNPASWLKQS